MILIKNGRLVNPATNTDEVMDVAIENGKILKVGTCKPSDKHR